SPQTIFAMQVPRVAGAARARGHRRCFRLPSTRISVCVLCTRHQGKLDMRSRPRRIWSVVPVFVLSLASAAAAASPSGVLDPLIRPRAALLLGQSRVVVLARDAASLAPLALLIQQLGGTLGRPLGIINGRAATVPNTALNVLAGNGLVRHIALDRRIVGAMERTGPTTGATAARQEFGLDGSGIAVAVIDSGITPWHDDL